MKKFALIVLMLLVSSAFAENFVAINSVDGRDVLSGVYYANVKNIPVKFMPMPNGNADVFAAKVGSNHDVLLIKGIVPVSTFVESALKAKNNTVEVFVSEDGGATNLELARLSGATSFIVVDSAYSDGALSVLPYAALSDSYVILANANNADDVADIVKNANKLMIYGYVDSEVMDKLDGFNPQIVGKGEDKFEDNLLIVEKTMDEFSKNTAIIVDGSSLEESTAQGEQPIILSGTLVPDVTYNYIKNKLKNDELASVMLIGNGLMVPIYDMREKMEQELLTEGVNKTFGIVVKFAQVIPSAESGKPR